MKKNMGQADQVIRLVAAAAFIVLFAAKIVTGTWGIVLLVLAVVFVATSIFRFCPLYLPFGIKTCKKQ